MATGINGICHLFSQNYSSPCSGCVCVCVYTQTAPSSSLTNCPSILSVNELVHLIFIMRQPRTLWYFILNSWFQSHLSDWFMWSVNLRTASGSLTENHQYQSGGSEIKTPDVIDGCQNSRTCPKPVFTPPADSTILFVQVNSNHLLFIYMLTCIGQS